MQAAGIERRRSSIQEFAPNCAALMEPGRRFLLLLDHATSHACRPICDHNKAVLHGTVEFQPPCSSDLSPLDFLQLVDMARSVSGS